MKTNHIRAIVRNDNSRLFVSSAPNGSAKMMNADSIEYNDDQLVELFQTGSEWAFEALLKRYESRIKAFIANNVACQYERDDVFQTISVLLFKNLSKGGYYRPQKALAHWIMRVTHNATLQIYRNTHRYSIVYVDTISNFEPNDLTETAISINENYIDTYINLLPEEQRLVIRLHYYENKKFKEIAKITKVPLNTAIGRAHYGIINLRKMIGDNFLEGR